MISLHFINFLEVYNFGLISGSHFTRCASCVYPGFPAGEERSQRREHSTAPTTHGTARHLLATGHEVLL